MRLSFRDLLPDRLNRITGNFYPFCDLRAFCLYFIPVIPEGLHGIKKYLLSLATMLCAIHSTAQNENSVVNLEEPAQAVLEKAIISRINAARTEKNLPLFENHGILQKAAEDQAIANRHFNSVSSEQSSAKKSGTAERVRYYGGAFHAAEEYDAAFDIQTKTVLKSGGQEKKATTYAEVADRFVKALLADRAFGVKITDVNLRKAGVGIAANNITPVLFVSLVIASEPYEKYPSFKYNSKSYKVAPYDKNLCKDMERNFAYLAELFSDNLRIIDNRIEFYYHDLAFIESLIQASGDGLAVDILHNDQFACARGNILHPSTVYNGMMLKPVKKSRLLKSNSLKDSKEFRTSLGSLPPGLDSGDVSMSLIIIKDNCACARVAHNVLNGKNIRMLDVDLIIDTISIAERIDSNSKYLEFTVPFEKNKSEYQVEDIKPFLDSIQLNRFNIREIEINAYASIEGNPISNEMLLQKRAESIVSAIREYQLKEAGKRISAKEDWDGFLEAIKHSPYYETDFKNKSHDEIRAILNSDTLKYDVEPFLAGQRRADIRIHVESIFIDSLKPSLLPEKFITAMEEKDLVRAKALQTLMYRSVLNGSLPPAVLTKAKIPQYREYAALANNRIAFQTEFYNGKSRDSLIAGLRMEVEALLGIAPSNGHLNFNKQAIKLYYWASDLNMLVIDEENHIDEVRDFYNDIRRLYNTKVDNYYVNRLLLNYNIIAADFYYEKQDHKNRVKSLKQVFTFVKKAKLNREQTYAMARYFIFQMEIDWAIQIMLPFIREGDYDEEFLITFLGIAVYNDKRVSRESLHQYFADAVQKYPAGFCRMFGQNGMGPEFFTDYTIKDLYCNSCTTK